MPCAIIPLDYTIGFLAKEITLTLSGIDAPKKKEFSEAVQNDII